MPKMEIIISTLTLCPPSALLSVAGYILRKYLYGLDLNIMYKTVNMVTTTLSRRVEASRINVRHFLKHFTRISSFISLNNSMK